MENKCFFCDKQKDFTFVADNDGWFSIFDKAPVSKGHALIIAKRHVESFFDLETLDGFLEVIKLTRGKIDELHRPAGYNIGVNDGRAAGRTIDHLHFHLIPRYEGDVKDPKGGVRNMLGKYVEPAKPS